MIINWYGEGCLKLQSGDRTILIDPLDSTTGLTPTRIKPDILIKTLESAKLPESGADQNTIIGPGEYNIAGTNIVGFGIPQESTTSFIKTIYTIELDDITITTLGHISEPPTPEILEHIEETDVVCIPAGGAPFLDQKVAIKLIKQVQPKIVIPLFFKVPGLTRKSDDIKKFIEEYGEKKAGEAQEKLTIKKKEIAEIKTTQVVILKI